MIIERKKKNYIKIIFFIAYFITVFYYMTLAVKGLENFRPIAVIIICFLLLTIVVFQAKKYKKKSLMFVFLVTTCGFLCYFQSGNNGLLLTFLFVLAAKSIEIDEMTKVDFAFKLIMLLVIIFLYEHGMTEIVRRWRDDGTVRYAMGFGHPNVLGAYLFFLCMDLFYIKYKKNSILKYVFYVVALIICLYVCDSRAAQVGIILILIVSLLSKKMENSSIVIKCSYCIPLILFLGSVLLTVLYLNNNLFAYRIDEILNRRIMYGSIALSNLGLSLFGRDFSLGALNATDNMYINMLVQFGIVTTLLFIGMILYAIKKSIIEKNYKILFCIIIFLIYGFMEKYSYMIGYNVFLIYFSNLIFFKETTQEE